MDIAVGDDVRRRPLAALIVMLLAGSAAVGAEPVVLDQTCWLRRYYRFASDQVSPAALKAQGRQVLGDAAFDKLKAETERAMRTSANDGFAVFRPSFLILREARKVGSFEAMKKPSAAAADLPAGAEWQDAVFRRFWFDPYTAPPPPADWAVPSFDDSRWVVDRGVFQADVLDDLPAEATRGNMSQIHVNVLQYIGTGMHAACYRAGFTVDDPARAVLSFAATYRGGIRVLVNGQEIARAHLPRGVLAPDAPADDYPQEAYATPGLRDRKLDAVRIPPTLLRAGVNILALEVRASMLHPVILKTEQSRSWNALHDREAMWRHGAVMRFELRGSGAAGPTRPAGLQVWAVDMHQRVRSDDDAPCGQAKPLIRLLGPRNGLCSGQVAVATNKDIAALSASAGELKSDGGAVIPASAIRVSHMLPFPAEMFSHKLGDERGLTGSFPTQAELRQYAGMQDERQRFVFDQISQAGKVPLARGRCRPLWVSLRIPAAAAPGLYRGTLSVRADDQPEAQVAVEAEVIGWRLPDPKGFQTYVGLEQNPYGVARQYGVAAWSQAHWKLLEASFAQIARAGGKWLNVPIVRGTEFGNRDDSMVRWVRKRDGSLTYDFAVMDKYLGLAVKHLGPPRMINFVVMPGVDGPNFLAPGEVMVFDEAGGKAAPLAVCGPGVSLAEKKRFLLPFATALHEHLKKTGLDKAMHWGYPLDGELDHELVVVLGEHLAQVKWHGGPHQLGGYKEPKYYDTLGTVRYFGNFPSFRMSEGWKAPQAHLTIPRIDSSVQSLITASHPFAFRTLVNHSLALGRVGFNRVGADEWASIHYDGMRIPLWIVGMPVLFTLWPGEQGAEPSARFEALIEGIQEGEARIAIEKAVDAGRLAPDLARRAQDVLARHYLETTFFQNKLCIHELEKYHYGWQGRARDLYNMARECCP